MPGSLSFGWFIADIVLGLAFVLFLSCSKNKTPAPPIFVQFRIGVWALALGAAGFAFGHAGVSLLLLCLCTGCTVVWCVYTVQQKHRKLEPFVSLLVPFTTGLLLIYLQGHSL